jgi:predicted DNA-binding transcriptional regulator YafY
MILEREIKELARSFGVPESTIERDYAQNWLLKYLKPSIWYLKVALELEKHI